MITIISQHLNFVIMFASAVVSAVITQIARERSNPKHDTKGETGSQRVIRAVFLRGSIFFLLYILLCFVTVMLYAFILARNFQGDMTVVFFNMIDYFFWKQLPSFFIIPFTTEVISLLFIEIHDKGLQRIRYIIAVIMSLIIITLPQIVRPARINVMPMESEILTELKTMPFPYEDRIFDIEHFFRQMKDGYWITTDRKVLPGNLDNDQRIPVLVEKDISLMTLRELLQCVEYHSYYDNSEEALIYLDRAYTMYRELSADAINDWNAVGRLFYFMGRYYDVEYYQNAADAFLKDDEFLSAAYCYRNWYDESDQSDHARRALSLYAESVAAAEGYRNECIRGFTDIYVRSFKDGRSSFADILELFCQYEPEDVFLNVLNIVNHVGAGDYGDAGRLSKYLSHNMYKDCPKLLILQEFYRFVSGESFSCANIYGIYNNHAGFFEFEDRINLVWLLYESGEYVETVKMTNKNADENTNESADEDDCVMLLLRAEAYLQGKDTLDEIDENRLYREVTDALHQRGVEEGGRIGDKITARLRLVQCILAGRIGLDMSYSGLSGICEELFKTDSPNGMYIVAALAYHDRDYNKAIAYCNRIIGLIDTPDYFYNRVLFLKADTLMGMAEVEGDAEKQDDYYEEAERLLKEVIDLTGNDYLNAMQRLRDLYGRMNRFDEQHSIDEQLMQFR